MPPPDPAAALKAHLAQLKLLRGARGEPAFEARLAEVRAWQGQRLARTYSDLAAKERYTPATRFFLEDLYGTKDFSERDAEMHRILPVMTRILPESAVETAALAIELDAISEQLDRGLADVLGPGALSDESYRVAYRKLGRRDLREFQIDLIGQVGNRLDKLVHHPLVFKTLKLMRTPARLAGLSDLQGFLERGFESFEHMHGAKEFLAAIADRETAIMNRLFSGNPSPFSL
jgi:hypothetical protein